MSVCTASSASAREEGPGFAHVSDSIGANRPLIFTNAIIACLHVRQTQHQGWGPKEKVPANMPARDSDQGREPLRRTVHLRDTATWLWQLAAGEFDITTALNKPLGADCGCLDLSRRVEKPGAELASEAPDSLR